MSFDEKLMMKLGGTASTKGRLHVDAGEATRSLGLLNAPGVDAKLDTEEGL